MRRGFTAGVADNQDRKVVEAMKKRLGTVFVMLFFLTLSDDLQAQTNFYLGKTIKIVVGYVPGDIQDLLARAYSRHMGKYIPGNPDFIVQNMPSAGSMTAANYVYSVAKRDGLTLGSFNGALYQAQLIGSGEVRFDWRKFAWIGSPDQNGSVFYMRADSPYKTVEDLRQAPETIRCSTTAVGTSSYIIPKLLEETLGLRLSLVTGYAGGAEQDLALEKGEVHCRAVTTSTFLGREPYPSWLKKGFVRILVQISRKRNPRLPDVPTIFELMDQYKTPEHDKGLVGVLLAAGGFGNSPIVSSPGIPADQIKILREAFNRTLRDQGFLEEAKKRTWEIRPVKGEELESLANEVTTQSSQIIESLKKFLGK